jgi:DNA-binding CsgD family transcriptional regulator/PAS domain-containing protein
LLFQISESSERQVTDHSHFDLRNYDGIAEWEALNTLIGQIYESVLHPEIWNETLAQIAAALCPLNWESAFILWEGTNPPRARFVAETGLAAGVQEMYLAVYAGMHPLSQNLLHYRNGSVVDSHAVLTREEFESSALARDFLKPWGIDRLIAVMLDRRGGERLCLILPGPGDRDVSGLLRGLRVLAPHLQRALRISERLSTLELASSAAKVAADQSPFAIFSLDLDRKILAANNQAARYVRAGAISIIDNKLTLLDRNGQKKLIDLINTPPPAGIAFQTVAANGTECPVLGARIEQQKAQQLGGITLGAAVILTLGSAPGETPVVAINRVAQWFGLTPSEARLAVAIAAGQSLKDYAAERASSLNAVRFLLKGVFRKSGASSQAQLVAMLASLPGGGDSV